MSRVFCLNWRTPKKIKYDRIKSFNYPTFLLDRRQPETQHFQTDAETCEQVENEAKIDNK